MADSLTPRQITLPEVGRFSIDEKNNLYWDGSPIQTESVVVLSSKQNKWGITIAVATMLSALATSVYTIAYLVFSLHPQPQPPGNKNTSSTPTSAPAPAPVRQSEKSTSPSKAKKLPEKPAKAIQ